MREFGYSSEISVLFVEFSTRLLHIVSQAEQSKQLLTKEIHLLSEETKYIFLQRKEKKCSLFYLMNPDNSNKNSSTQPLTFRCDFEVKFKKTIDKNSII